MSSNKSDYLLTFEWDNKNETLEIHCNQKGLAKLCKMLDSLCNKVDKDHIHLMTPEWGGKELSEEKQSLQNKLINHVKIFKWNDEV